MAREETIAPQSSTIRGTSPYADTYLSDPASRLAQALEVGREVRAEESQDLAEARSRRQEEIQQRQEERANFQQQIENRKAQHQTFMEDQSMKLDQLRQHRQELEDRKISDNAAKEEASAVIANQISLLDAHRPDYQNKLNEIIAPIESKKLIGSKYGKEILLSKAEKDKEHSEMAKWLQGEAQKYGHAGSIYDLPTTKEGDWDLSPEGKIYGEVFPAAYKQKREALEATPEYQAQQAKLRTASVVEGRQRLGYLASQKKQEMAEAGDLSERELMQAPDKYLDAKGKPTSKPEDAVTGVYKDKKGKFTRKIDLGVRNNIISRIKPIMQAEQQLSSDMLGSTSLPSGPSQSTTDELFPPKK